MKLKCETILDIYTYRNTKVLCQIKVQSSNDNKQISREWKNTCRCMSPQQWNSFEKELKIILKVLRDKPDKWNDEIISTFSIQPNIEVKAQKSKLSPKHFYKFMDADDDNGGAKGSIENTKKIQENVYVLELIFDYKQQPPSISSVEETQEYEPKPKMLPDNIFNRSLSYEPYTPSKKKYRANSLEGIKTPGVEFLQHESVEAEKTTKTEYPIPAYKPAPIKAKRSSQDSQTSKHSFNDNEVIPETDEELLSPEKHRSKVLKKKTRRGIKYISKSEEKHTAPKPMEERNSTEKYSQKDNKSSKHNNKDLKQLTETLQEVFTQQPKPYNTQQGDVKERISNKLEYKEKLPSKKSNQEKVKKILERKATTSSSEDDLDKFGHNKEIKTDHEESQENDNVLNITLSSVTESATTDVSPPSNNIKEKYNDAGQLRRSRRSPIKPKRLIEEQCSKDKNKKKLKTQKTSPTNKELFGTDYEDDEDDDENKGDDNNNDATNKKPFKLQTPKCKSPKKSTFSASSSSTKKKRKRDKSNECEQEKRDIVTWLGKKKSNSEQEATTTKERSKENSKSAKKVNSSKDPKRKHSKSESPPPAEFVMPTKEELEKIRVKTKLQQEQNEKMKAQLEALEAISAPPPKEVQTLSLKDMSVKDLLDTFSDYKQILDEIYKKNCKKDHIKSHEGLNHCFVIRLMEHKTQYEMLQKLTDVYRSSNSTTEATVYANAMLPEWIIRIYMEKYKFTRAEAMQQIKAQDDYQLHIDEQSDNSFMFE